MLDLRRLRLLRELAYRETIAAVAHALAFTPSAVSQQLAILEREAGVPLLERTGRRVRLTPAARTLVAHTEDLLARLEHAEAALAAVRRSVTGTLRIGAFPSAARALLPDALVALGRECPDLELTVEEFDPALAAEAIRTGELDVALTHDYDLVPVPEHPALESVTLLTEPMFVASRGAPPDPDDPVASFRHDWWIMGRSGNQCRLAAERICQAAGFQPRIRHRSDDYPTVLALVAADQGQAILPRLGTEHTPAGVVLSPLSVSARIAVTHRRGGGTHPAIAAFRRSIEHAVQAYVRRTASSPAASG
jgi:DNA-binding transcriptional LysR family regulator